MFRFLALSLFLFLYLDSYAQFGQMDLLMHFHPAPGSPSPAWPQAHGEELLIYEVNGGASENYIAVGNTVDPNTGFTHLMMVVMDVGFAPSYLKQITHPDLPYFTAKAVCRRSNGDVFIGAVSNNGNATSEKFLIKTDALGAVQWCMQLGDGSIQELVFNKYDDRVLVYGEADRQIYLGSFNPNTGAADWTYTYTANPVAPLYRAGGIMIDPSDEQILLMNTGINNGVDERPFALKLDRLTGSPLWSKTYQTGENASISNGCFHNGSITMAGILKNKFVLTMNINPLNGDVNWSTWHKSSGKRFLTTDIDYNPSSDQLFVVGGVTDNTGYSDGFILPVTSSGGNLVDFRAHSTAYAQGPIPVTSDYIFNDIDVDVYSYNSNGEMILSGTGASNGTTSYNGGMWTMRTDMWGENTQVCPQDIPYNTSNVNFTWGDGYKQYNSIGPSPENIFATDVIHNEAQDCQYMLKKDFEETAPSEAQASFLVYPNPTSEWLHVFADDVNMEVTVTDAQGRTVLIQQLVHSGTNRVNVSALSTGMYFLHHKTNGQATVRKFFVNEALPNSGL